ncbi:MAG: c-type cytochrome [Nannocystaceae bacterium]|nr:c-type cytochrome [bacterium]
MSTTLSMWLGIAFLALAIIAVLLQAWLWGPKFWNEELKKTEAPKFWLRMHALAGYGYGAIYVVMMWNMLPRLWEYQYELPARTVFHAVVGITIGVLLICKILILLFFRHFEESMPYYGFGLLLCTVILSTLSIPYAVQAHDFSGRTTDPANIERVQKLLANVDFGEQEVDIEALTTHAGFERGRQVLVKQCIVCHDMRTILAKPRTPQRWYDVSMRMLDKPSVFGEQLRAEDIPAVTAYLAAITPEIQKSTKERRLAERKEEENTDAMVDMAHEAEVVAVAKIDPAKGEALLEEHCTACHELDENETHGPDDLAGWRSVVAAMVEEGAEFDDEVATEIARYLAQKYPAKEVAPADAGSTGADTDEGETEGETEAPEPEPEAKPEPKPEAKPKKPRRPKKPKAKPAAEAKPEPDAKPEPEAKPAPEPKPKKPKTDKKNGRAIYMAKCKTCHGADGKGDTAFGRKLGVTSLAGLSRSRIETAVIKGVPGTKMKSYSKKLTAQEIDDVSVFVKGL